MDDLTTLLRRTARTPAEPMNPVALRKRVQRRTRARRMVASAVVAVALIIPVTILVAGDRQDVLLDTPPSVPEPTGRLDQPDYGTELDITAEVDGPLSESLTVTGLSARAARRGGLGVAGDVVVIVTADIPVQIDLAAAVGERDIQATVSRIQGTEIVTEEGNAELEPGIPTVVSVQVRPDSRDTGDGVVAMPFTEPLTVQFPINSANANQTSALTILLQPRQVTVEDLGLPGPADLSDQQFPRPAPGEGVPEQLADGTPIWIVGLDEDVVVVGARSPHPISGLVGWCGTLPGFIDSPGAARFDARGAYRVGPAPTGLTPYEIRIAADTVTVLRRLAPPPRPDRATTTGTLPFQPIDGSDLEQGVACESDADRARLAGLQGAFLEDYTAWPGWVQHDLSAWAELSDQRDGWYHTDVASLDGVGRLEGDLLVRREDGVTIDIASPPGASRVLPEAGVRTGLILSVSSEPTQTCASCAEGSIELVDVVWVTPTQVLRVRDGPAPVGPASIVPASLFTPSSTAVLPLSRGVGATAHPGEVVGIDLDSGGRVTRITPVQ